MTSKDLIDKILAGDTHAFQTLIEEHQRLVSHIVGRMITREADREDLFQEIFIKVYQNLSKFRFKSKFSTWVAKIAYNTCINYLQKKKPNLYEDISHENKSLDRVPGNHISPEEKAAKQDLVWHLQKEIQRLPIQFRTVITLFHLDEMTYHEIAEIMNLPLGTVKSYLFRARKLLKDRLRLNYSQEITWKDI